MTREQAKELLPVIQAFSNGKPIQADYRDNPQGWRDYDGTLPGFDNENWKWRVKPEPLEFWLKCEDLARFSDVVSLRQPAIHDKFMFIHFREVLE